MILRSAALALAFLLASGVIGPASAAVDGAAPGLDLRRMGRPAEPDFPQSGNPLWAIPLSTLTSSRERPIFLPSRRPPAPAVAGPPPPEPAAPPPAPAERPKLTLIGAVVGETGAIAVFLDPSRETVRLRTGQDYAGWVLNAVRGREAVLQKDDDTAVFALPVPSAAAPSVPGIPGSAAVIAPAVPSAPAIAGDAPVVPSTVGAFAPFVPRHTPKNGEHDGL